jgi:hypothetical protein
MESAMRKVLRSAFEGFVPGYEGTRGTVLETEEFKVAWRSLVWNEDEGLGLQVCAAGVWFTVKLDFDENHARRACMYLKRAADKVVFAILSKEDCEPNAHEMFSVKG